jgi:beta-phosphoglucomutase-like phosphatase (HAD superfamily)
MVDAVLLEWEGVLADTRQARRDALRGALAAEGISHTLSDDDEQLRGLGVSAAVGTVLRHMGLVDPALADLLVMRATRSFAERLTAGVVLVRGTVPFVERMQSRTRVAIVTRATRGETELILRSAGLEDAVTTTVCCDDVECASPSARAFGRALDQLARVRRLEPLNVVAVVDAGPAIRAARTAGVRVLAVGAPFHEAMEADAAVDTLDGETLDGWVALVGSPDGRRQE